MKKVGKTTRPFRYELNQIPYDYFQRIARRDKKAFLSDQCKEIEENNRMRKTRDLFKKIRVTKGTFHAKMGMTKMVWTLQKQKILRRSGKGTQKNCTKMISLTQITMMV